jgi:hypothetical protein
MIERYQTASKKVPFKGVRNTVPIFEEGLHNA